MKELFASHLKANLPRVESFHPFFNEALAAMLECGGKHFRAQLLLGVVEALKPNLLKTSLKDILNSALAVEFIHTYSLIHDDLPAMDNADFRRGVPTLHKRYDEVSAILVGDALNTQAFLLLSSLNLSSEIKLSLINTLAFNAGLNGMVLGQAIDCYFEKKKLSLNELEFLHIHKTAKLIAASLKMGAQICELDLNLTDSLYELGLKLGLAFQINDDIIDLTQSPLQSGKPSQNDTYKNSFVNLLGLDGAKQSLEKTKQEIQLSLKNHEPNLANLIENLIKKYL